MDDKAFVCFLVPEHLGALPRTRKWEDAFLTSDSFSASGMVTGNPLLTTPHGDKPGLGIVACSSIMSSITKLPYWSIFKEMGSEVASATRGTMGLRHILKIERSEYRRCFHSDIVYICTHMKRLRSCTRIEWQQEQPWCVYVDLVMATIGIGARRIGPCHLTMPWVLAFLYPGDVAAQSENSPARRTTRCKHRCASCAGKNKLLTNLFLGMIQWCVCSSHRLYAGTSASCGGLIATLAIQIVQANLSARLRPWSGRALFDKLSAVISL